MKGISGNLLSSKVSDFQQVKHLLLLFPEVGFSPIKKTKGRNDIWKLSDWKHG